MSELFLGGRGRTVKNSCASLSVGESTPFGARCERTENVRENHRPQCVFSDISNVRRTSGTSSTSSLAPGTALTYTNWTFGSGKPLDIDRIITSSRVIRRTKPEEPEKPEEVRVHLLLCVGVCCIACSSRSTSTGLNI